MSLEILIKGRRKFREKFFFNQMIDELCLDYGSYDDFSILKHKKMYGINQAIIFNPQKIGLGIFLDGSKVNKGVAFLMMQSFSTKNEINCLFDIIEYIISKYNKYHIYINGEYITYGVLLNIKEKLYENALDNLKLGCKRTIDYIYNLRLALFPFSLSEELRDKFGYCDNLDSFEDFIHEKQKEKIYFAYPKILKEKSTAYYTLKENCKSIFPIDGNGYFNKIKVDEIYIKFENNEIYSYKNFINLFSKNDKFDDNHIYIKSMTKEEIETTIEKLKQA